MAIRRMISLRITDTDNFLDMPVTSQNLYFHMLNRADDDGFLGNVKKIMRIVRASEDDLKILVSKDFVIPFDNGVCVIKHWRIHNIIRADRYTETIYKQEKRTLLEGENKEYISNNSNDIPNDIPYVIPDDNHMEPQVRLGKVSIGKVKKERKNNKKEIPFSGFKQSKQRSYTEEYKILLTLWNSLDLPECRKLYVNLPNWGEIMNSMKLYTLEEIQQSIANYQTLRSRKAAISYSTFPNFLVRGIEKYADSSIPFDNFKKSEDEKIEEYRQEAMIQSGEFEE